MDHAGGHHAGLAHGGLRRRPVRLWSVRRSSICSVPDNRYRYFLASWVYGWLHPYGWIFGTLAGPSVYFPEIFFVVLGIVAAMVGPETRDRYRRQPALSATPVVSTD